MSGEGGHDLLDRLALRTARLTPSPRRGWRAGLSRRDAIHSGARVAVAATLAGTLRLGFATDSPAQERKSCIPCLEAAYKRSLERNKTCKKLERKLELILEYRAQLVELLAKTNKKSEEEFLRGKIVGTYQDEARVRDTLTDCIEAVETLLRKERYKCVGLADSAQTGCDEVPPPGGGGGGGGGGTIDPCGCVGADVCCGCIHPEPFKICCIPEYACVCCPQS
jgi:hypothetical protein